MSGSLMSHNFKDFTVIFTTNILVPAISDNTFVSAIIHNTFATIPLSTIPYTDIPEAMVVVQAGGGAATVLQADAGGSIAGR